MKGMALDGGSAASTPTNWTIEPLACSAAAVGASSGVSCWQGTHHEAKKLRTTGWWRCTPEGVEVAPAGPPATDGRVKSGRWSRPGTDAAGPACRLLDVVRDPTNRTTASATAMTTPMRKARRRRGGAARPVADATGSGGGARRRPRPPWPRSRAPGSGRRSGRLGRQCFDEDVDRHDHEQQRQVGDRVAEQLHRRLRGGLQPQPDGQGDEDGTEHGGRHEVEDAEVGHRRPGGR